MFELTKRFTVEAAHWLPEYDGPCANLHGHRWVIGITVRSETLGAGGMVTDFREIKKAAAGVIATLDHGCVNDVLPNPTSERLAEWVYAHLETLLPGLVAVSVEETETSKCEYRRDRA